MSCCLVEGQDSPDSEKKLTEINSLLQTITYAKFTIDCFHDPIMQYVLGGSLHKNNAIYLLLGLYHASVN